MDQGNRWMERNGRQVAETEVLLAARSDANVLLTGPTEAARAMAERIHRQSGWRYGPFTVIDCTHPDGLEERLAEACNSAADDAPGPTARLLQAGAVLLQEVGRTPEDMQGRLVEQLEELRRGRSRCRVFASSSEPLVDRVERGTFDDRLFYRLNMLHLFPGGEQPSAADS